LTLSGKHEGDAHTVLLRVADEAKAVTLGNDRPSVLILDDIDRSVAARRSNTTYTINSELLVGTLQDLANDHDFGSTINLLRLPIILTGNNFACLPETLVRPGRMRFFTWQPNWQEKFDILLPIVGDLSWIERRQLRELVRRYHGKGQPLAFFIDLLNSYVEQPSSLPSDCTDILQAAQVADVAIADRPIKVAELRRLAEFMHHSKARSYLNKVAAT
jgi:hypothetical protein